MPQISHALKNREYKSIRIQELFHKNLFIFGSCFPLESVLCRTNVSGLTMLCDKITLLLINLLYFIKQSLYNQN